MKCDDIFVTIAAVIIRKYLLDTESEKSDRKQSTEL